MTPLLFATFLCLASPTPEDFRLVAPEIRVSDEGDPVVATVTFTSKVTWQGLSFGIRHDPEVVELVKGEPTIIFPPPPPPFIVVNIMPEGAIYGWVLDFCCSLPLPPVEDAPIAQFTYRAAAGAKAGDISPLAFTDTLGRPPVVTVAVAQAISIRPQTKDGSARIVNSERFIRGDGNRDGRVNIADPVFILGCMFSSDSCACADAQDANDDGFVDIADPIYVLNFLFAAGPGIPAPYPDEGIDPTADGMNCE